MGPGVVIPENLPQVTLTAAIPQVRRLEATVGMLLFTNQGTISLTVSRDTEDGQEWINFAVGDTGIGMTDEQMGRLFEAFAQAEASTRRDYGGIGLRLAITRNFCEMMGSTVLVESESGKGFTFNMKLPAIVDASIGTPVTQ